jgi:hypothetical protein
MADRAALVEKVAKSLWSLQYLTPYETDANSSAKIEFRAIAEGLIDRIRAEVLEEAASHLDKAGCEQGAIAIRELKGDSNDV